MNQVKKRKTYQQPQVRIVEVCEVVPMLASQSSGQGTIGDLIDGGNLGDNTSGNGTIDDLNWEDLGGNSSGGAKNNTSVWDVKTIFGTMHYSIWDD